MPEASSPNPTMPARRIALVAGYHPCSYPPPVAYDAGLRERFAVVLSSYRPDKDGMFFDADLFVRLNDVDETGKSINICDGIVRKSTPDPSGTWRLNFKLHATAHRFAAGHSLVIAAGAHPRYARNTGTDESFGTATTLRTVDFNIFHDIEHPSAIHLPVFKN